MTRVEGETGT